VSNLGETLVGRASELRSLDVALSELERNGPSALALVGEPGTSIAVAVNAVTRNTAVAIGAQVAFVIIAGADVAATFPVESGYTWTFVMGGLGAAVLLLTSASMPGRTLLPAAEKRERDPSAAGTTDELLSRA
jgi:hypothetical protein